MKVVIAIDSLKGSLSSMDAGNAIKNGILKAVDAEVIVCPLADGGEGTTDALIEGMGGEKITLTVNGPLGAPTEAFYGYLKESNTWPPALPLFPVRIWTRWPQRLLVSAK